MTVTDGQRAGGDEAFIRKNGITQITRIPPMELAGTAFAEEFTVVIGNNRYHGATIAEAVAQSTMTFDERFAA